MAEVGEDLRLSRTVVIPASELEWRYVTSGGPGGQHANTSNTRAEVRLDISASPSIPDYLQERLIAKLGPVVAFASSDQRSQYQNRRDALGRLEEALRNAAVVPRRRVPTRPTRGSKKRRLDNKKKASERKTNRRRPSEFD